MDGWQVEIDDPDGDDNGRHRDYAETTRQTTMPAPTSLRQRANAIKPYRCKNLITVLENSVDIRNIGTALRNVIGKRNLALHEADYTHPRLAVWFGNESRGSARKRWSRPNSVCRSRCTASSKASISARRRASC